jgi:hypothetical protein
MLYLFAKISPSMPSEKRRLRWLIVALVFIAYTLLAAQPVPREVALDASWFASLRSTQTVQYGSSPAAKAKDSSFPFILGSFYGYLKGDGSFLLSQKGALPVLGSSLWAEYQSGKALAFNSPDGQSLFTLDAGAGYPFFINGELFLLSPDYVTLSRLDNTTGKVLWSYDFVSPLTDIDTASKTGEVLAGCLNGTVELLSKDGKRIFTFEPGGSRLAVILGCRLAPDASSMAIVSGIDEQRFLYLERSGGAQDYSSAMQTVSPPVQQSPVTYRVVYHEFLGSGFRRRVALCYLDSNIVFERQGGVGIFDHVTRTMRQVLLPGRIEALECSIPGDENNEKRSDLLFALTSEGPEQKRLAVIKFPGRLIMQAPCTSSSSYLLHRGSTVCVGGGDVIASFNIVER